MLIGHLHQTNTNLPAMIEAALQHLRDTDYTNIAPGKYPIDAERMFALVQDPLTQDWETGRPEYHARHIDVQYLLAGEEVLGFLPANASLLPIDDLLEERDIAFVAPQANETRIVLTPGMYAVFFPGELHRPCRALHAPMHIKKVVIKILAK
ncbi:YhcH/YjgK/YiaL family protein [Undibacterium flavidum]|uniref:YhcH/YjgK/YiaL family protein n=1 Tax=Undibacterium flavidum TaxID=2762297 RepID=A0ABR6YGU0_9BURK|nr:YhcH/YjgK/YiaL family protein [Undibacterium flavidum]MBC3875758.1 YhcH/YjgK/YiaL family protein [Undibacterium flavidum]